MPSFVHAFFSDPSIGLPWQISKNCLISKPLAVPHRAGCVVCHFCNQGLCYSPFPCCSHVHDADDNVRHFRLGTRELRNLVIGRVSEPQPLQGLGKLGMDQGDGLAVVPVVFPPPFFLGGFVDRRSQLVECCNKHAASLFVKSISCHIWMSVGL